MAIKGPSFDTIWNCLINTPVYISRSFHAGSIQSAFDKSGVCLCSTRKYSAEIILSHFPHWNRLNIDQAEQVLNLVPDLANIFNRYDYIPEEEFGEVLTDLESKFEVKTKQNGLKLNDMVINRQRCLILKNNSLIEHEMMRKEDERSQKLVAYLKRLESGKPKKKTQKCSDWACLKQDPVNGKWIKCPVKYCRMICCGREQCLQSLEIHKLKHSLT
jgi:hypothetical protein